MARDSWLKRLIWLRGSPAGGSGASYEKTVGPAPILSISDAKAKPAKSLIVGMEPIQDLHGYDNPWPAGGVANRVYKTLQHCNISPEGTIATLADYDLFFAKVESGKTYTISINGVATRSVNVGYFSDDPTLGSVTYNGSRDLDLQATFVATYSGYLGFRFATGTAYVQLEEGSTATTYAPYSNICPISGRTGVTVTRTGKNLLKLVETEMLSNGWRRIFPNPIKKAGTYTISVQSILAPTGQTGASAGARIIFSNDSTGANAVGSDLAAYTFGSAGADSNSSFVTEEQANCSYIVFRFNSANATFSDIESAKPMVELGSTASTYEPYTGTTYPVSWQTEAGTVYGGTVDVVSGVLTVTMAMVDLGTLTWTMVDSYAINRFDAIVPGMTASKTAPYSDGIFCSAYNPSNIPITQVNVDATIAQYSGRVFVCDSAYSDAASFKSGVSGVQLCYELATPQTFQLTPQQIQLLKGSNTLWSDADDLTLTYLGTTPANLLGGMLGGGLGGGYNPPAEQDPEELTEPEATETDEPAEETPAEEGENNGE